MMKLTAKDVFGNNHEVDSDEMVWRPSIYGIVIDDDKILLSPQHGIGYDLPGGGAEMHETFTQAVVREVKEETGIDVWPVSIVGCQDSFFAWKPDDAKTRNIQHSILVYMLCEKIGGKISTEGFDQEEKDYAEAAEWVDLKQINAIKQASSVDYLPYIKEAVRLTSERQHS